MKNKARKAVSTEMKEKAEYGLTELKIVKIEFFDR